jgi:hypothetical protein
VTTVWSRLAARLTAVLAIASFGVGRPAMQAARMTGMACGPHHGAHHGHAPGHHAPHVDGCPCCACPCAATPEPPIHAPLAWGGVVDYARSTADRTGFIVPAARHRLPFPIGPPHPLA